ncbi:phosphatidylinositol 4-phosphate 3-kinase C2 domain-containing subunit alpha-like [Paramacrobiotus metropolitanus]|uniref:phosphatidylinositol 4-phosphate 3-kinase C2 domain-containing subunit alpha-like n=1 Tax=Paramacrobiotus metropolitanus TaxID=2943436 RepID=UPI002445EEAC|nr:phosphatidylinositol 4-phosphate 3-kinase C2 domain-containing subunit alpha-like [Paramacrobiotus metropolitanus]
MSLPDISQRDEGATKNLIDFSSEVSSRGKAHDDLLNLLYACGTTSPYAAPRPRWSQSSVGPLPQENGFNNGHASAWPSHAAPHAYGHYNANLQNVSLSGYRVASIPNASFLPPAVDRLLIRSSTSTPAFPTAPAPLVKPVNVVSLFQKETAERLKKTGDLIDFGLLAPINHDSDWSEFDPLRPFSVSSDSSTESVQLENGELGGWTRIDDMDLESRRNSQTISLIDSESKEAEAAKDNRGKSISRAPFDAENDRLALTPAKSENENLRSFFAMVFRLQKDFRYDDELTNVGYIRAPMVEEFQRNLSGSIKLNVHHRPSEATVSFDCDVQTSVEHAIFHVLYELKGDQASLMQMNRYMLRIHGRMDCLSGEAPLADYQHVHTCRISETPLNVSLLDMNDHRDMRRTLEDDQRPFILDDICKRPKEPSLEDVEILIDIFEREVEKYIKAYKDGKTGELPYNNVSQTVKAVGSKLRRLEPHFITTALDKLFAFTHLASINQTKDTSRLQSQFSTGEADLRTTIGALRTAIVRLFHLYTTTFRSRFSLYKPPERVKARREMITVLDPVKFYIDSVHSIPPEWKIQYSGFYFSCSLHYSRENLHVPVDSNTVQVADSFFGKLAFEQWIEFRSISICSLPRETKVILSLYGSAVQDEQKPSEVSAPVMLGWISFFLFDCDWDLSATATCHLHQGDKIIGLWRTDQIITDGPALCCLNDPNSPLLWIELPEYDDEIIFPAVLHSSSYATKRDFDTLDDHVQQKLQDILERDMLQPLDHCEKELIWERRNFLHSFPGALPRILQAAHAWDWASLSDIYAILDNWPQLNPVEAMQLLLNTFPDEEVRRYAVNCVRQSSTEALSRFLPQLVQAIKLQNYDANALTKFLLESALHNINIAHDLYWLLKENIHCPKLGYRYRLILNALLNLSGRAMRDNFMRQEEFNHLLTETAVTVKNSRDTQRTTALTTALQVPQNFLSNGPVNLAINSAWKVVSLDIPSSCYFPSFTVPIKLSFKSIDEDADAINVIYKCGDDLRQDQLAMQLIRIMDKMWQMNGLDLQMITFTIRQTDLRKGFIEAINNAETLRKIQVVHGVTGAFKDKPLASWLIKHNPSEAKHSRAVDNFTKSCAGYCVATYVLGACDRHSDNIMITHDGHMFHIDFGKFLGDAQTFGGIRRDRVPFVLTSDMVYVINGGEKPTIRFQEFVDLCCQAFNILRRNGNTLITLFEMMIYSDIPGVTRDASRYVQRALMLDLNDTEATASFTRLIEESVKSWFTQFNFFLHNLAQLRFSAENTKGQMLSFSTKAFSQRTDPRITSIECFGYQKRFDPHKYYVYIFKVYRENQREPTFIFRSYREVTELYEKLCMMHPSAKLSPVSRGVRVGRTNVKNVAQKRLGDVQAFLQSLLNQPEELCHCDLVYTFFHAFPRDSSDMQVDKKGLDAKRSTSPKLPDSPKARGLVKLSIHYKENQGLCVLVNHAKDLVSTDGNAPDPYVKTYLYPDISRTTKRKTKIVRKSRHPTFNEMLLYRMPLDEVKYRVLKVTVWNYDRFKENQFLGGVAINLESFDLTKERSDWYPLACVR